MEDQKTDYQRLRETRRALNNYLAAYAHSAEQFEMLQCSMEAERDAVTQKYKNEIEMHRACTIGLDKEIRDTMAREAELLFAEGDKVELGCGVLTKTEDGFDFDVHQVG